MDFDSISIDDSADSINDLIFQDARRRTPHAQRDEVQPLSTASKAEEEHLDLLSLLDCVDITQTGSRLEAEGESVLIEEEEMLQARAKQLQRDVETLRIKKEMARLHKVQERLKEEADEEMNQFEDSLQVGLHLFIMSCISADDPFK